MRWSRMWVVAGWIGVSLACDEAPTAGGVSSEEGEEPGSAAVAADPEAEASEETERGPCREIRWRRDADGDGDVDKVKTWTYEKGRRVRRENDYAPESGPDGTPETTTEWEYEDGDKVRMERSWDPSDDEPEELETWTYEKGRKVRKSTYRGSSDGDPVQIDYWDYDEDGNKIRWKSDPGADGDYDDIRTWRYDERGRVVYRAERRGSEDTEPFLEDSRVYDSEGNEVLVKEDMGGDAGLADPDVVTAYEYDEQGNKVRRERYELPSDGDDEPIDSLESAPEGEPETVTEWSYDDADRKVRETHYDIVDGDPKRVETWTYEDGRKVRWAIDGPEGCCGEAEHDGDPDRITTYEYNDVGEKVREAEQREPSDEGPERVDTWEYTPSRCDPPDEVPFRQ